MAGTKEKIVQAGCVVIFITFFAVSCVTNDQFTYLNDQLLVLSKKVTALDGKVSQLQEAQESTLKNELDNRLQSVTTSQAEMRVELDQIKEHMKEASGRIEDNEHIIKRFAEKELRDQGTMTDKAGSMEQLADRITELETVVRQQQDFLGLEALGTKKQDSVTPVAQPSTVPEKSVKQTVPTVASSESKELELYNNSLSLYRGEDFGQSIRNFQRFVQEYPKSDRADNAHFWIGECYMALKQYEKAILSFEEVIKRYAKGNKVPSAMLRQAVAFLEIKDKTSAKVLFQRIVKSYPKSNEAKIAQNKLKTL